jgi:Amino acid synthesis
VSRVRQGPIETYGKGAIVGVNGELEHGAIWHEAGGWSMRAQHPKAKAIVPSAKVVAGAGTRIQTPLHSIEACYVRSHFSSMDVAVIDGPRPNELLYAPVMGTGGRVHERLGGLRLDQISVGDGQR